MKNYFQKIITLFTGNDYPESTQQDFYKWLVDEEHTSEKDEALQKLWDEAHKRGTATDMQESYELLKCRNTSHTTKKNNPTDSYVAGCRCGFLYSGRIFGLPFYHR